METKSEETKRGIPQAEKRIKRRKRIKHGKLLKPIAVGTNFVFLLHVVEC